MTDLVNRKQSKIRSKTIAKNHDKSAKVINSLEHDKSKNNNDLQKQSEIIVENEGFVAIKTIEPMSNIQKKSKNNSELTKKNEVELNQNFPTLIVESISKSYKKRNVVDNASFEVESGQIVGLLGPNGAGKTTSFYIAVGLISPNSGRVLLDGVNITKLSMYKRAQIGIGYLPQEASVFRKMTVFDNIFSVYQLRKVAKKQAIINTMALLDELHITHIKDELGISLSGGERRRTEIARSLATDPKFILLDEPFAGVDPISIADIKNIINHLKYRNIGVLITDHNVRETLAICDKAYIMSEGKVIANGTSAEILSNEQVKAVYLGDSFSI